MKNTVFIPVSVKDRLPEPLTCYLTDIGMCFHHKEGDWTNSHDNERAHPDYWLEKRQLPTDDEILEVTLVKKQLDQTPFMRGVDFILNKIKRK